MELVRNKSNKNLALFSIIFFQTIVLIPSIVYAHLRFDFSIWLFILIASISLLTGTFVMKKLYVSFLKSSIKKGELFISQKSTFVLCYSLLIVSFLFFGVINFMIRDLLVAAVIPYHFLFGTLIWLIVIDTTYQKENLRTEIS